MTGVRGKPRTCVENISYTIALYIGPNLQRVQPDSAGQLYPGDERAEYGKPAFIAGHR